MIRDSNRKTGLCVSGEERNAFCLRFHHRQKAEIPYDSLIEKVVVAKKTLADGELLICSSNLRPSGTAVLYLYEGLFMDPPKKEDYRLVRKLVEKTGCDVYMPLVPLFPDHLLHEAAACVSEAIESMTSRFPSETSAVLAFGEGGMYFFDAFAKAERESRLLKPPARLILSSPILQIPADEEVMKQMKTLDVNDVVLPAVFFDQNGLSGTMMNAETQEYRYLGDPLSNISGALPETDVYYGSQEILREFLPVLQDTYAENHAKLHIHEGDHLMHNWGLYDNCKESRETIEEIISVILGLQSGRNGKG